MLTDDATALMTRDEFRELPEYSISLPTGQTIGKRWRRDAFDGSTFLLGEFVHCDEPGMIGIKWREIAIVYGAKRMKVFQERELFEALQYAAAGGLAIHLHRIIPDRKKAPRCFVSAVDRGENIAHLFCSDREKLVAQAKRLGVKVIFVDKDGTDRQHIDLCGAPLKKAVALAERYAKREPTLFEGEADA